MKYVSHCRFGDRRYGLLAFLLTIVVANISVAQDSIVPKIDFIRTIQPILESRCNSCHNPEEEEAGLVLTDPEIVAEQVLPGEPAESMLYQSILGLDGLSVMPPEEDNDGNPLEPVSEAERALIFLWIQQGASFDNVPVIEKKEESRSLPARAFLFSGYFHPAVVHFPIALFTISAFFIVFCFRSEILSDDAAFYLLLLGTLSSIVASVLGWAFADRNPVPLWDLSIGINRHRWLGIATTVLALITTVLAWRARNEVVGQRSGLWKVGVLLTAALVGIVGHQGGEEVYGEGFYDRAAQKLIPELWPFNGKDGKDGADGDQAGNEEQTGNGENTEDQKNSGESSDTGEESEETSDGNGAEQDKPADPTPSEGTPEKTDTSTGDDKSSNDKSSNDKSSDGGSPPVDPTINSPAQ